MNQTARLALERAAARQSGQKHATLAPRPTLAAPVLTTNTPTRTVTELPPRIDRVRLFEGQRAAKDLLASMVGILTSHERTAGVLIRLHRIDDATTQLRGRRPQHRLGGGTAAPANHRTD